MYIENLCCVAKGLQKAAEKISPVVWVYTAGEDEEAVDIFNQNFFYDVIEKLRTDDLLLIYTPLESTKIYWAKIIKIHNNITLESISTGGGAGGDVISVNGKNGVVLLSATDILSQVQLNAVNSGITAEKVAEYDHNLEEFEQLNGEVATLEAEQQVIKTDLGDLGDQVIENNNTIATKNDIFQVKEVPLLTDIVPNPFQYIGETEGSFIKGHFYEKKETDFTQWQRNDNQTFIVTMADSVVDDDVYQADGKTVIGTITDISDDAMTYTDTDGQSISTTYHSVFHTSGFEEVYQFDTDSINNKIDTGFEEINKKIQEILYHGRYTDIYVDYQNGTDNNDGLTEDAPRKTIPDDEFIAKLGNNIFVRINLLSNYNDNINMPASDMTAIVLRKKEGIDGEVIVNGYVDTVHTNTVIQNLTINSNNRCVGVSVGFCYISNCNLTTSSTFAITGNQSTLTISDCNITAQNILRLTSSTAYISASKNVSLNGDLIAPSSYSAIANIKTSMIDVSNLTYNSDVIPVFVNGKLKQNDFSEHDTIKVKSTSPNLIELNKEYIGCLNLATDYNILDIISKNAGLADDAEVVIAKISYMSSNVDYEKILKLRYKVSNTAQPYYALFTDLNGEETEHILFDTRGSSAITIRSINVLSNMAYNFKITEFNSIAELELKDILKADNIQSVFVDGDKDAIIKNFNLNSTNYQQMGLDIAVGNYGPIAVQNGYDRKSQGIIFNLPNGKVLQLSYSDENGLALKPFYSLSSGPNIWGSNLFKFVTRGSDITNMNSLPTGEFSGALMKIFDVPDSATNQPGGITSGGYCVWSGVGSVGHNQTKCVGTLTFYPLSGGIYFKTFYGWTGSLKASSSWQKIATTTV